MPPRTASAEGNRMPSCRREKRVVGLLRALTVLRCPAVGEQDTKCCSLRENAASHLPAGSNSRYLDANLALLLARRTSQTLLHPDGLPVALATATSKSSCKRQGRDLAAPQPSPKKPSSCLKSQHFCQTKHCAIPGEQSRHTCRATEEIGGAMGNTIRNIGVHLSGQGAQLLAGTDNKNEPALPRRGSPFLSPQHLAAFKLSFGLVMEHAQVRHKSTSDVSLPLTIISHT